MNTNNNFPNVPEIYGGMFPAEFNANIVGWGNFAPSTIAESKGQLLMLDLDFGRACSLNCGFCFTKSDSWHEGSCGDLSTDQIKDAIRQAKEMGLRCIKILGAGEPFQNKEFVGFLRWLTSEGLDTMVFSTGHIIGDDEQVAKYNGHLGITTGEQLATEIARLRVSVVIKYNTTDTAMQEAVVKKAGYAAIRNRAIELLVEAGLNKCTPTRLGLGTSPITKFNVHEAFDMYEWAMRHNFTAVICPTMCSGRCGDEGWKEINPHEVQLVDLYTRIYRFNIDNGIQTLGQIMEEGISAYAGVRPCNQVGNGLYVTQDGIVRQCPGNDVDNLGDVRELSLKEIWENSTNYRRSGRFNYHCPAKDGRSIPAGLYDKVLANLRK